jgi:molecular chaperone GrpE (heat shock protein)
LPRKKGRQKFEKKEEETREEEALCQQGSAEEKKKFSERKERETKPTTQNKNRIRHQQQKNALESFISKNLYSIDNTVSCPSSSILVFFVCF